MLVEICLPVKNEEKILALNLQRLLDFCEGARFEFEWKIIGISNGSSDGTVGIFTEFEKRYTKNLSHLEISLPGRGRAIKQYWLKSQADIVCYLDIDLAVSPDQLTSLLAPIIRGEADLVIGSRLLPESKTKRSFLRETVSRTYNFLARLVLANKVSDLQCGFKAIKEDVFKKIEPYLEDDYWFFDTEMVSLARHFSYRIYELPDDWNESRYANRVSKVKIVRDIIRFIGNLVRLRYRLFFLTRN